MTPEPRSGAGQGADPTIQAGDQPPTPVVLPRQHVVRRTRIGGVWVAAALFAVVLLLLLIFILENGQRVSICYFGAHGHLPVGVALLLAAVAGVLLVVIPGTARIIQLRITGTAAPTLRRQQRPWRPFRQTMVHPNVSSTEASRAGMPPWDLSAPTMVSGNGASLGDTGRARALSGHRIDTRYWERPRSFESAEAYPAGAVLADTDGFRPRYSTAAWIPGLASRAGGRPGASEKVAHCRFQLRMAERVACC